MKKRLLQTIIFFVLYGAVLVIDSYVFPIPENTAADDTINFTVHTHVFENQWQAEQVMGGGPALIIDSAEQIENLQFESPAPAGLEDFPGPFEEDSLLFFAQMPGTIFFDDFEMVFDLPAAAQKFVIQQFEGEGCDFDLVDKSIVFVPVPNGKSFTAGIREILLLPADTAGSVNPEMADDASVL